MSLSNPKNNKTVKASQDVFLLSPQISNSQIHTTHLYVSIETYVMVIQSRKPLHLSILIMRSNLKNLVPATTGI